MITLNDDYRVQVDKKNLCMSLEFRKPVKKEDGTTGEKWVILGYFSNLPHALRYASQHITANAGGGVEYTLEEWAFHLDNKQKEFLETAKKELAKE